jgi:hypothetical protein
VVPLFATIAWICPFELQTILEFAVNVVFEFEWTFEALPYVEYGPLERLNALPTLSTKRLFNRRSEAPMLYDRSRDGQMSALREMVG